MARLGLPVDFDLPDSDAALAASELCAEVSPRFLRNHAMRTYGWACLLAVIDDVEFDRELLCVASLLHDVGLTDRFRGPRCFEVESAAAAVEFAHARGWGRARCAELRHVIRLHMQPLVTPKEGAEAYLLSEAAACDVTGTRYEDLPRKPRDRILSLASREGFKQGFTQLFLEEAQRKPGCMADVYMRQGLVERIGTAPFPDW
ncbi:MAG TPA: HD domain-containing protein [Actinomycetota bacterium]